ncbi:MAG TPA: MBL fold metallo-hydrolase [Ilumatobacteraceae bacterium]|nr:MBL fold metallo-hydrolase [Ilumatobacteraceae bacterium]
MAKVDALATSRLKPGNFVASLDKDDLVYFLLNVGDADAQVVLLPEWNNQRRVIIVDAGVEKKVPALLDALVAAQLLKTGPAEATGKSFPIALLVATHPHDDHIRGLAQILDDYPDQIAEFWESGYFHTAPSYHHMMAAVEKHTMLLHTQPTSGMQRWIGHTGITVLSPSIHLRNRYDTYGVDINDSSISLKIEHPSSRVLQTQGSRNYQSNQKAATLILGGDAQTLSWSFALTDFPVLQPSATEIAKFLQAAKGDWNLLNAAVLKVSHHASKRGVNLELVERISPSLTLVSCDGMTRGKYGFPHDVAQEVLREAIEPRAGARTQKARTPDSDLNLFYTGQGVTGASAAPAGSIAVVMKGLDQTVWRFRDKRGEKVDLSKACKWD